MIGIKSTLADLAKVVPLVWITRLLFGEDKNYIIFLELGLLVGICNNISHFFQDSLIIRPVLSRVIGISRRNTSFATPSIFIQIYLAGSIESYWDDVSAGGKVVKELGVLASNVVFRNFHVIQVTRLDVREVRVLNFNFPRCFLALFTITDDQLLQDGVQSWVVIGLTNKRVHERRQVDLSGSEHGRLIKIIHAHEVVQKGIIQ